MPSSKIERAAPPLRDGRRRQTASRRLPYEKPVLRSTSLVADQVLGVGCKQEPGIGIPLGTEPALGCLVNSCRLVYGT